MFEIFILFSALLNDDDEVVVFVIKLRFIVLFFGVFFIDFYKEVNERYLLFLLGLELGEYTVIPLDLDRLFLLENAISSFLLLLC